MLRCCASMSPKALFNNWQGFRADTGPVMHSGWPDPDRVLRKKWKGIEMMNIKSLYEISEITVWRKGMIVFSWRSPSSPSSELSGKNGEDKVTGKRDGVIRELKPRRQQISKILPLQAQSTFSVECTFVYPLPSLHDYDVKLPNLIFSLYRGTEQKIAILYFFSRLYVYFFQNSAAEKFANIATTWTG